VRRGPGTVAALSMHGPDQALPDSDRFAYDLLAYLSAS
jgi:hypothetical protein